jgi:hypothetical protein
MFDKKLLYTLISIGAVVIVAVTLDSAPQRGEHPEQISETGEAVAAEAQDLPHDDITPRTAWRTPLRREQSPQRATRESLYIVREHEGHIAVFQADATEPQIILETQVKFLPDYDRRQLREGIPVSSYEELTALIEDYIS